MMGDEDDAMPAIDAELKALLGWGMLARQETGRGEVVYPMHALVRDYARRQLAESAEDETALLLRAARFWELQGQQSGDLGDWLRARDYYYRAGEYEKAFEIVASATEPMMRWGLLERLIGLLNESIGTLEGTSRAVAMGNLANVYELMGDYKMALQMYDKPSMSKDWQYSNGWEPKGSLPCLYIGWGGFTRSRGTWERRRPNMSRAWPSR
jgi:tetratricopeptide (TPR) repeat protein